MYGVLHRTAANRKLQFANGVGAAYGMREGAQH